MHAKFWGRTLFRHSCHVVGLAHVEGAGLHQASTGLKKPVALRCGWHKATGPAVVEPRARPLPQRPPGYL